MGTQNLKEHAVPFLGSVTPRSTDTGR